MKTILSTKILTEVQKATLSGLKVHLVEHNFVNVKLLPIRLSPPYDFLIFTSQNAVKSLLQNPLAPFFKDTPVLCVGERTAQLLQQNSFQVRHIAQYAVGLERYLSNFLDEFKAVQRIAFFAGTQRLETLPNFFAQHLSNVEEITAYQTELTPITLNEKVDIVLFFSPSGVESYCLCNPIGNEKVFCIGNTTAEVAQLYWKDVMIAAKPTIDAVLFQVSDYL